jgi:hypothetical protein
MVVPNATPVRACGYWMYGRAVAVTSTAADAGSAVVPDNQSQLLESLKFPQDGPLARAVPSINHQVYPPSVPVTAPLGDDRQELDLTAVIRLPGAACLQRSGRWCGRADRGEYHGAPAGADTTRAGRMDGDDRQGW